MKLSFGFPLPLDGEGLGGGEARAPSSISTCPRTGVDRGRNLTHVACELLPSPLTGEGWVGVRPVRFPPSQPSPTLGGRGVEVAILNLVSPR
jgi:hypothetical protein